MIKDNKPTYILFHCSAYPASSADRLRDINNEHKTRGFDMSSLGYNVGYHVLITGGVAHRTRQDEEHGDHCNDMNLAGRPGYLFPDGQSLNFHSVAVCVDFNGDNGLPTEAQRFLLKAQIKEWMQKFSIPLERVKFHRDFTTLKTCPGALISRQWLLDLLADPAPVPAPPPSPVPAAVDTPEYVAKKISLMQTLIALLQELLSLKKRGLASTMNMNDEQTPAWYQSTQGPEISATLKFLALLLIPTMKDLFGFTVGSELVDHLIDAALIIVFGIGALIAHARAKQTLDSKVATLRRQVQSTGARPHA